MSPEEREKRHIEKRLNFPRGPLDDGVTPTEKELATKAEKLVAALDREKEIDPSAEIKKANTEIARLVAQVERMRVKTEQMGRDWDADLELTARAQARVTDLIGRVEEASRDLRSLVGLTASGERRLRLHLLRVLATLRGGVETTPMPEPGSLARALDGDVSALVGMEATVVVPCDALHSILRDGMSVRFACQRPIGHDDEHSHTSRSGTTTVWPSRA